MLSCERELQAQFPSTVDSPLGNVPPPDHVAENQAVAHRVGVVEVDIGEVQRTRGGLIERRVVRVIRDFGSRVRGRHIRDKLRRILSPEYNNNRLFRIAAGDGDIISNCQCLSGREEVDHQIGNMKGEVVRARTGKRQAARGG